MRPLEPVSSAGASAGAEHVDRILIVAVKLKRR
jgi:hypothetical protein